MKREREIHHLFDLVMKRLLHLSNPTIVRFINGMFGKSYPPDSDIEYPNPESVSRKLRRMMSDMIIIVGDGDAYHLEAEIRYKKGIVLRVFEYGFAEALRTQTESENGSKISVRFPESRIILWESAKSAPDEVTLELEFPGGGRYDYSVKTFKFPEHSLEDLAERNLLILLPFCVMKLRRSVAAARSPAKRRGLHKEITVLLDELVNLTDQLVERGIIIEEDIRAVLEYTEVMYRELYQGYEEFREADTMLQNRIMTYSEEAKLLGRAEGIEEGIAQGITKGIAQGITKGIAQGLEKRSLDVARSMLADGVAVEIIQKYTGLSKKRILALR